MIIRKIINEQCRSQGDHDFTVCVYRIYDRLISAAAHVRRLFRYIDMYVKARTSFKIPQLTQTAAIVVMKYLYL